MAFLRHAGPFSLFGLLSFYRTYWKRPTILKSLAGLIIAVPVLVMAISHILGTVLKAHLARI